MLALVYLVSHSTFHLLSSCCKTTTVGVFICLFNITQALFCVASLGDTDFIDLDRFLAVYLHIFHFTKRVKYCVNGTCVFFAISFFSKFHLVYKLGTRIAFPKAVDKGHETLFQKHCSKASFLRLEL